MTKGESKLVSLQKAVYGLDRALAKYAEKTEDKDFFRDSAIQRFEMSFDLAWKTLKEYLREEKGITVNSPKEVFRAAYSAGLFKIDEPKWLEMTDDRNFMSHVYDETKAEEIFEKLGDYLKLFEELVQMVVEK